MNVRANRHEQLGHARRTPRSGAMAALLATALAACAATSAESGTASRPDPEPAEAITRLHQRLAPLDLETPTRPESALSAMRLVT